MLQIRAAFHTLGCKTNHYETDALRRLFTLAGFEAVPFDTYADVYIINTCTVTGEAGRKSRQILRRARKVNPDAIIVAIGCHAELEDDTDCADIVIGNTGKRRALRLVCDRLRERGQEAPDIAVVESLEPMQVNDPRSELSAFEELGPVDRQSETRAYIKIEDGCNSFCSYCTIPYARGRVRSRARDRILEETAALAAAGYREIVLTGIHVCSYGADAGLPSHAVMELAQEMSAIHGLERIRLGSLEPLSITPRFIELAVANHKLLPHFHLSLQSGSDPVLARMNRRYRTQEYRDVVARLRQAYDQPGLTTDIIVGFPGETETEHADSLAFCLEMGFSRIHVFRYSARSGTAAAGFPNPVPPAVIGRRSEEMIVLADRLALDFHRRQIGRPQTVLLEKRRPDGLFEGYSPEYVPVRLADGPGLAEGQIVQATGCQAECDFLLCHHAKIVFS